MAAPRQPTHILLSSPPIAADDWFHIFHRQVAQELAAHAQQINRLAEGQMEAHYLEYTAVPTASVFDKGDFVRRFEPLYTGETSATGSSHIHVGWMCVSEGSASAASFTEVRWRRPVA